MNTDNNIDNLFKEGLGNFEPVPSEKTWGEIESALFAAPKPVPFFLRKRVIAAVLLLLLTLGGWLLYSVLQTNDRGMTDNSTKKAPVIVTPAAKTTPTTGNTGNTNNNTVNKPYKADKPLTTDNSLAANTTNIKKASTVTTKAVPQPAKQKLNETIFTGRQDILSNMPYAGIHNLTTLPLNEIPEQHHEILTVEQYVKKRSNLHFYTGATVQAGMIYYPSTKDQFTYAAGADFGLKAGKFYFESGIGYRHITEQGNYKINFKTQDSIGYYNHVTSFEVNPQNPNEIILNYKKTTVYDSVEHIAYTAPLFKYDYLTVPLRIGYRVFNANNLFIALETGIEYSRLMSSFIPDDGFYYEGSDIVQIVNNTPARVENNWKFMFSVRVGIKLNKSISIIAQPEFSKYLTSVYEKQYDPMKPYMMNLRAGIYFDF